MLGPVGKKGWIGMRARLKVPKLSPAETQTVKKCFKNAGGVQGREKVCC